MKHIWNPLCLIFAAIVLAGAGLLHHVNIVNLLKLNWCSISPINFNGFFWVTRKTHHPKSHGHPTIPPRFGGWEAARAIFFAADFFWGEVCGGTSPRTSPHEKTQGSHVAVDDGYLYASIRKDLRFTLLDIQAVPPPEVSAWLDPN